MLMVEYTATKHKLQSVLDSIITTRCTTAPSAVFRLHVVCPSVSNVGGSGPHRLKILHTNYPNTFALRSLKAIHQLPGEDREILGRLEDGGVGKVACWSTKVAISLKRVKTEERLLWMAYRKSLTLFRMVPFPTPTPFSRLEVCNPHPKLNRYYLRNG